MLDANYLNAIKQSEGYTSEARWDYAQNTNGYGTRARFAGEVIDKAEADKKISECRIADSLSQYELNVVIENINQRNSF